MFAENRTQKTEGFRRLGSVTLGPSPSARPYGSNRDPPCKVGIGPAPGESETHKPPMKPNPTELHPAGTVVAAEKPSKNDVVSCWVCFVLGEIVGPKLLKDREAVVSRCVCVFMLGALRIVCYFSCCFVPQRVMRARACLVQRSSPTPALYKLRASLWQSANSCAMEALVRSACSKTAENSLRTEPPHCSEIREDVCDKTHNGKQITAE